MTAVCSITAVVQRGKEVRTQGATRYKRRVHFLKDAERKEYISILKIDK